MGILPVKKNGIIIPFLNNYSDIKLFYTKAKEFSVVFTREQMLKKG